MQKNHADIATHQGDRPVKGQVILGEAELKLARGNGFGQFLAEGLGIGVAGGGWGVLQIQVLGKGGVVAVEQVGRLDVGFGCQGGKGLFGCDLVLKNQGNPAVGRKDVGEAGDLVQQGLTEGQNFSGNKSGRGEHQDQTADQHHQRGKLRF